MKIAIVGSRDFPDLEVVKEYVRGLPEGTVVISGGARGVDSTAEAEARLCGLEVISFVPDWNKHGKKAGFLRNVDIVEACDKLVAFWDGKSKGTQHSLTLAKTMGKEWRIIFPAWEEKGRCLYDDCTGFLDFYPEDCSCHLGHPPCGSCVDAKLQCHVCGWQPYGD